MVRYGLLHLAVNTGSPDSGVRDYLADAKKYLSVKLLVSLCLVKGTCDNEFV